MKNRIQAVGDPSKILRFIATESNSQPKKTSFFGSNSKNPDSIATRNLSYHHLDAGLRAAMDAKINHSAQLYKVVAYNQQKVDAGTARIIDGNRIIADLTIPELQMQRTLLSFENHLLANRNTEKPILHISLNPTLDDRLTDTQFAALARDYMEKMGYGNQPYMVYLHEDIERRHIHIVSTCVDDAGRKISDKYEWRRSMKACRELEQNTVCRTLPISGRN